MWLCKRNYTRHRVFSVSITIKSCVHLMYTFMGLQVSSSPELGTTDVTVVGLVVTVIQHVGLEYATLAELFTAHCALEGGFLYTKKGRS